MLKGYVYRHSKTLDIDHVCLDVEEYRVELMPFHRRWSEFYPSGTFDLDPNDIHNWKKIGFYDQIPHKQMPCHNINCLRCILDTYRFSKS